MHEIKVWSQFLFKFEIKIIEGVLYIWIEVYMTL